MRKIMAAVVSAIAATLIATGCSSGSTAADKPSTSSSSASQEAKVQKPVSVPKTDPDEDQDVTGVKLVERGGDTYLVASITNYSSEKSDYDILVDYKGGTTLTKDDVPAGARVTAKKWLAMPESATPKVIKVDRFSQEEGKWSDDKCGVGLMLQDEGSGVSLAYDVGNKAEEVSVCKVKYQIRDAVHVDQNGNQPVVYVDTFETKGLDPGYFDETYQTQKFGGEEKGLVPIPPNKIPAGVTADGLVVEKIDVDREAQ